MKRKFFLPTAMLLTVLFCTILLFLRKVSNDMSLSIKNILLFLTLLVLFPALTVFAQDSAATGEDFWISAGADAAMFSISNIAYGGGLALGYGKGVSIGFKAAWFFDGAREVKSLEFNVLLRWFIMGASSGPFLQINAGPVFFAKNESMKIPSEFGAVSAGLSFGWRFRFGRFWFVEGAIRGGYPFIAGCGIFAGCCL